MNTKLLIAILIALLLQGCSPAMAAEIPFTEANIIKALAGEAGGQGMDEIIAHAHAIKNRGHLGGVYGIRRVSSQKALERARNGWNRACGEPDRLHGSDHWLSDYDLKHSRPSLIAWRHKAVYSVKVGSTRFYKLGR